MAEMIRSDDAISRPPIEKVAERPSLPTGLAVTVPLPSGNNVSGTADERALIEMQRYAAQMRAPRLWTGLRVIVLGGTLATVLIAQNDRSPFALASERRVLKPRNTMMTAIPAARPSSQRNNPQIRVSTRRADSTNPGASLPLRDRWTPESSPAVELDAVTRAGASQLDDPPPNALPKPSDDTQNELAFGFDRASAMAALSAAAGSASSCGSFERSRSHFAVTFAPSGRATHVIIEADSPLTGTIVGRCVAIALLRAKVPRFAGSAITLRFSALTPR